MGTMVREKIDVGVNIVQRSITYMVNTTFQVLLEIIKRRNLRPDLLIQNRKVIEDGLFTWLAEQSLLSIHLEVSVPGVEQAEERWDTIFEYLSDPNEQVRKPPIEALTDIAGRLQRLPEETVYRIIVSLKPDATEVPGWVPATFKSIEIDQDITAGEGWGFGNLGGKLYYKGGKKV